MMNDLGQMPAASYSETQIFWLWEITVRVKERLKPILYYHFIDGLSSPTEQTGIWERSTIFL